MSRINTCWITVNRSCNLRCKWCYAYDTGFKTTDDLDINAAYKIVDFCSEMEINRIILIGGEPTLYPHILPLIKYIANQGIKSTLVTNGLVFSKKEIAIDYISAGLTSFSISVKANNKEEYIDITGSDCYDRLLQSINNLSQLNANFSVSQVLTYDNITTFCDGIKTLKDVGAKSFSFSFCYNFNCSNQTKSKISIENNPFVLADIFKNNYQDIDKALDGCRYSLSQGLPLCVWDMDIINEMSRKHSVNSICQLLSGSGILFNTNLALIPCNAMYQVEYGIFLKDFSDKTSFKIFYNSKKVQDMFKQLRGIPDMECLKCDKAQYCGGGCVTNWTNYSFTELQNELKNDFEKWKNN